MTDLKSENEKPLTLLLLLTLIPFYLSLLVNHHGKIVSLASNNVWLAFVGLAAAGAGPFVCVKVVLLLTLNNVSPKWKERLVHLRWDHPLPGSRADRLIHGDARLDIGSLPQEALRLLDETMSPFERNAYWYKHIFRPVRDTPAVYNTHRRYLLYREGAAGAFMAFGITTLSDIVSRTLYSFPLMDWWAYLISAFYVLLLIGAASSAGNRLVTGAIANHPGLNAQGDAI